MSKLFLNCLEKNFFIPYTFMSMLLALVKFEKSRHV